MISLPESVRDLDTAEAFLDHFGIAYDESVVRRARLHILQRFHDYLRTTEATGRGRSRRRRRRRPRPRLPRPSL